MRLLCILVTITALTEAKKRRPAKEKKISPTEDDRQHEADVYPQKFVPVPFGHIFKEGFQPNSKQPIDLLELDTKYTKSFDELRDIMEKNREYRVSPKGFASPKDSFYFGKKETQVQEKEFKTDVKGNERDPWLDLAATHTRNLAKTRSRNFYERPKTTAVSNLTLTGNTDYQTKEQFLSRTSFGLEPKIKVNKPYNWTTCDEFGRNADFHPKDVINIDWVPFYTWSLGVRKSVAFVHRFTYPTVKLVQKYKDDMSPYLNKTLDWEKSKLYLKSDVEMLLVAVDRKGEFDAIPYNEVPTSMKKSKLVLPMVNLRLKIVDPYLAMMFCDYKYATIMAVSGNEPNIRDIRSEAAALKFKGRGYPVARDLEAEKFALKLEKEIKIQRERDRFIEAKDQAESGFPFEL